jgi:hypothetical protein
MIIFCNTNIVVVILPSFASLIQSTFNVQQALTVQDDQQAASLPGSLQA